MLRAKELIARPLNCRVYNITNRQLSVNESSFAIAESSLSIEELT